MSDLRPSDNALEEIYTEVIRVAVELPGRSKAEDPLGVLRARARHTSDRLAARVMFHGDEPWAREEIQALAGTAVSLAAELARGLDDCLNAGVLDGYAGVLNERLPSMVEEQAGAGGLSEPTIGEGLQAEIDTLLGEVNIHAGALRLPEVHNDILVREGFATIGAATAMAAYLSEREADPP